MKRELTLILENCEKSTQTLEKLKSEGFNATIISTDSLRHAVESSPNDQHFYTLRHYEKSELLSSILCVFIIDEKKIETLKNIVREYTNNFKDTKGIMYSRSVEDYEGSF